MGMKKNMTNFLTKCRKDAEIMNIFPTDIYRIIYRNPCPPWLSKQYGRETKKLQP
jgi:hypothetical protein